MKKKFVCMILTSLGACAAHAQSSVTLYGRVSAALDFVNHVATPNGSKSLFRYGNNQYGASFLGILGKEDIGGGTKIVFNLEDMFFSGNGQVIGNALWNRYAYVGVSNDRYGSLWAGRAMVLSDATEWYLDPFVAQQIGVLNFSRYRGTGQAVNALTYNSPEIHGLSFRLQNGFGNTAGNFKAFRTLSASVQYSLGGFTGYGLYDERRDANGNFSSLYGNSKEYMVGATYQLQGWKFYTGYQQLVSSGSDTVVDPTNTVGATRANQEWVGVSYQVNPPLQLQAAWYHTNVNHGGGSANLAALGATYNLSKRTFVYVVVGAMFNGANAAFPVETQDSPPEQGHNQQGGYVGIMSYF
ncbi:gram-negative porin family protein [Burkholderia cenocepacia]|uniref:Gram-negative porin family protein n=1 Tax=Burkholderia cenocepacia TaxID=95486 RepID=A0AAN0RX49_9BURK|nr:gram-negative porin family protein [Burkholderia cenocepacia]